MTELHDPSTFHPLDEQLFDPSVVLTANTFVQASKNDAKSSAAFCFAELSREDAENLLQDVQRNFNQVGGLPSELHLNDQAQSLGERKVVITTPLKRLTSVDSYVAADVGVFGPSALDEKFASVVTNSLEVSRMPFGEGIVYFKMDQSSGGTRLLLAGANLVNAVIDMLEASYFDQCDKITDRVFAKCHSEFLQPHFADARCLLGQEQIVTADISSLFSERVVEAMVEEVRRGKIVVFENPRTGFLIVPSDDGFRLDIGLPLFKEKAAECGINDFGSKYDIQTVENFLNKLRNEKGQVGFIRDIEDAKHQSRDLEMMYELAYQIYTSKEALFLKSTRRAEGESVFRIRSLEDGRRVIESDDENAHNLFQEYLQGVSDAGHDLHVSIRHNNDPDVAKNPEAPSVLGFIASLVSLLDSPIIEQEIPVERISSRGKESCKVEFRLICDATTQQISITDYCKVSANSVAGNISTGGWGESSKSALRKIYRKHFPKLTRAEINKKAHGDHKKLHALTRQLAEVACSEGIVKQELFAIDVVPVWNKERGEVDFYLMEIQRDFGFSGLEEVNGKQFARISEQIEIAGVLRAILGPAGLSSEGRLPKGLLALLRSE